MSMVRIAASLVLIYLLWMLVLMLLEEKLIYFPTRYPDGYWNLAQSPAAAGEGRPQIEDCQIPTSDGLKLHGWYCSPSQTAPGAHCGEVRITLLWFHGNAGNLSYRYDMILRLVRIPVDVFILDYRGYGKSDGHPSESGLYLDGMAAWEYLVHRRGISPSRIVLFGKSLGSAVAVDLATRVQAAGLIVQSGFTSIPDMAAGILPIVPRILIRTQMDSLSKISRIASPKLFIHSPADEVVPYRLGKRLYEAAREPKQFFEIANAPHNETYLVGGEAYLRRLREFVESCRK
jgi:fermentation-respiration switch protein FrsA (DUF1100 family)